MTLACALTRPDPRSAPEQITILRRLSTLTPTASATAVALAAPVEPKIAEPTPIPQLSTPIPVVPTATPVEVAPSPTVTSSPPTPTFPSNTPTSLPTATVPPPGWAFAGVQLYPSQEDKSLLLYGHAINNTGGPQALLAITGIFYDGQGQVIADGTKTYAYWPGYVIPAGESMPFELFVEDIDSAARYDLVVEAEPSTESPRQDFEFAQVNQWIENDAYCVEGVVYNSGSPIVEYLVVAALLYDNQNNLVNFSDDGAFNRAAGSNSSPFEICVGLSNQQVARHELQAWGR